MKNRKSVLVWLMLAVVIRGHLGQAIRPEQIATAHRHDRVDAGQDGGRVEGPQANGPGGVDGKGQGCRRRAVGGDLESARPHGGRLQIEIRDDLVRIAVPYVVKSDAIGAG